MGYTEKDIIEMCEEEMKNPSTFYQADVVNYRGRTTDTGELYNEIVARYVCEHLDEFINGIPTITREETYKTESHEGHINPNSNREEERIAVEMFNQKKFDFIGEIIDYQTPLKNTAEDVAGKIDLLSYDGKTLYILELKKPDSKETMLRCVLEGFTYMKTVDTEKLLKDFELPPETNVVACPLVFLNGEQHKEMEEERPWLKKIMMLANSKPYYVTKENDKYKIVEYRKYDGTKGLKEIKMDLNKILDYAIMVYETSENPDIKAGYVIGGKTYDNYLDNTSFAKFVTDMEEQNPIAHKMYGKGGGKELEERKVGANIYPPKMASFGSSSRMIYNLMKNEEKNGFRFEEKLSTTVGGKANLDGFMEKEDKYIFVEAKCREPYSQKRNIIDRKYEELYGMISKSDKVNIKCNVDDKAKKTDEKGMKVTFLSDDKEIHHFDLKQMICHLLGVATAFLNGKYKNKNIEFVYLLFNPNLIKLDEGEEKILKIYNETCNECNSIDFKALFEVIVDYLQTVKNKGKDKNKADIVNAFTFKLCDQSNMSV